MIKVSKDNETSFICTAPTERRINVFPQGRQWVVEFTICDTITPPQLDELLTGDPLTFSFLDDVSGQKINTLVFDGYVNINSASIKYEQDLSCTAFVQLGKEVTTNANKA